MFETAGTRIREGRILRSVGGAAEAVTGAKGDARRMRAAFERSAAPIVMVDSHRRYVELNRPARLWFRRSVDEMREYAMEDLAPEDQVVSIARDWARLLAAGCIAGRYPAENPGGGPVETVYIAVADALPGLHVIVFAPADWPEEELALNDKGDADAFGSLTPREIEVLALAADGLSGRELADELALSPATVKTHLKNVYMKLGVNSRAAAVARAIRLGVID